MNDDLISRQALIQALNKYADDVKQDTDIHEAIEIAINLPTVQPKIGHWIERRNRATGRYESVCSVCGAEESSIYNLYCGNCGTEMQFT